MPTDTDRELDYQVALALGWKWSSPQYTKYIGRNGEWIELPPYSTDPGSALAALTEFCGKHGFMFNIAGCLRHGIKRFRCEIVGTMTWQDWKYGRALPEACCFAIIAAEEARKGGVL